MTIAVLYEEGLKEYDFGPGHPFRGDRYEIFPKFLKAHLTEGTDFLMVPALPASMEDLLLICQKDYIDFVTGYYAAAHEGRSYPGNFSQYLSWDNLPVDRPGDVEKAARLIIGQAKKACELVQEGQFAKAVSIGGGMHHAKPGYGEGFCIYNDIAFAARYLINKYSLDKILILDTDAHAGNGTAEYFYEDPRVLFVDIHQDPRTLYPGSGFIYQMGSGPAKGFNINIPMPVYAGDDAYEMVFNQIVLPVTAEFKPQIIIRNGGSDPHFNDGLTNLGVSLGGFHMIGDKVRQMAEVCQGKEVDMIGSGYNPQILPYGWLALLTGVAGISLEQVEPKAPPQRVTEDYSVEGTAEVIAEVKRFLKDYWKSLR
jgi:acetoin utilization protein AcuC